MCFKPDRAQVRPLTFKPVGTAGQTCLKDQSKLPFGADRITEPGPT